MNTQLVTNLGWLIGIGASAAATTGVVAATVGDHANGPIFFGTAALMTFVAATLVFGFRGRDDSEPSRPREGLAFIIAAWVVLPIFFSLPIAVIGDMGSIDAYFEAVSVFTTTGATGFLSIDALPRGLIFWRALVEWMGGALTLVFAVAALDVSRSSGGAGVYLLSAGLAKPSRLIAAARELIPVYAGLTGLCFVALKIAGLPGFDALCLALSSLATGGAMPTDGDIAHYGVPMAAPILVVAMALGATSFLTVRVLRTPRLGLFQSDRAHTAYALIILGLVALLTTMVFTPIAVAEGRGLFSALGQATFVTISLISTSGLVYDATFSTATPLPIVAGLLLVGGAYGSTAGGLKIGRVTRMIEDASAELRRLIHPSALHSGTRERGGAIENRRVLWSYLTAYMLCAGAVALCLAAAGQGMAPALAGAISTISNAGPAILHLPETTAVFHGSLPETVKMVLIAGMIVGRIEILAILGLLTPLFWRD